MCAGECVAKSTSFSLKDPYTHDDDDYNCIYFFKSKALSALRSSDWYLPPDKRLGHHYHPRPSLLSVGICVSGHSWRRGQRPTVIQKLGSGPSSLFRNLLLELYLRPLIFFFFFFCSLCKGSFIIKLIHAYTESELSMKWTVTLIQHEFCTLTKTHYNFRSCLHCKINILTFVSEL